MCVQSVISTVLDKLSLWIWTDFGRFIYPFTDDKFVELALVQSWSLNHRFQFANKNLPHLTNEPRRISQLSKTWQKSSLNHYQYFHVYYQYSTHNNAGLAQNYVALSPLKQRSAKRWPLLLFLVIFTFDAIGNTNKSVCLFNRPIRRSVTQRREKKTSISSDLGKSSLLRSFASFFFPSQLIARRLEESLPPEMAHSFKGGMALAVWLTKRTSFPNQQSFGA